MIFLRRLTVCLTRFLVAPLGVQVKPMKLSPGAIRAWVVAACFGGLIGFNLVVVYLKGQGSSEAQACSTLCKRRDMDGHMVDLFSAPMTAGMRGRGPKECRCFRAGTYNPRGQ
jgi:hypothetical protein